MKKFRKTNEVDDLDLDNLESEEEIIEEKKDEMIEKIENLFGNQINIEVIND